MFTLCSKHSQSFYTQTSVITFFWNLIITLSFVFSTHTVYIICLLFKGSTNETFEEKTSPNINKKLWIAEKLTVISRRDRYRHHDCTWQSKLRPQTKFISPPPLCQYAYIYQSVFFLSFESYYTFRVSIYVYEITFDYSLRFLYFLHIEQCISIVPLESNPY